MESRRESNFLELGKKRTLKLELVHTNVGDQLRNHIVVALIIMLLLLRMQVEKLGFIAFRKNMVFLLLRNG